MSCKKSCSQIGIHITNNAIRVVKLVKEGRHLHWVFDCMLPLEDAFHNECFNTSLSMLRRDMAYKLEPVVVGMKHGTVWSRVIRLDVDICAGERLTFLKNRAAFLGGFDTEPMHCDYFALSNQCEKQFQWQVVVAKKADIDYLRTIFKSAGYCLKAIDVDCFAIFRLLCLLYPDHSEFACFLLWVDHVLSCYVFQHGGLVYQDVRDIHDLLAMTDRLKVFVDHEQPSFFEKNPLFIFSEYEINDALMPLTSTFHVELNPLDGEKINITPQFNTHLWVALALATWGWGMEHGH